MERRRLRAVAVGAAAVGTVVVAAAVVGVVAVVRAQGDSYAPRVDPARFTDTIDNPYLPLRPGTRWEYRGTVNGKSEQTVVEVTSDRRTVMGVACVVVRETTTADGQVTEDAVDWYAQDADGNVWGFGEETKEFEAGKLVGTEGSWEAGVKGAQPGIAMKADPRVGDHYRKEYYRGEAEDTADVVSLTEHASVQFGSFDGVRMTRDYTPLEPNTADQRYYAKDVGLVLIVVVKGGTGRTELVRMTGQGEAHG